MTYSVVGEVRRVRDRYLRGEATAEEVRDLIEKHILDLLAVIEAQDAQLLRVKQGRPQLLAAGLRLNDPGGVLGGRDGKA